MMKKREETNVYQVEELLGRAAMMTKYGHVKFRELYTALREAAMKGGPCEFRFNHYLLHYNVKDEFGNFLLHWHCVNGVTGRSKIFLNKDYVSPRGNVLWRKMASDMKKV